MVKTSFRKKIATRASDDGSEKEKNDAPPPSAPAPRLNPVETQRATGPVGSHPAGVRTAKEAEKIVPAAGGSAKRPAGKGTVQVPEKTGDKRPVPGKAAETDKSSKQPRLDPVGPRSIPGNVPSSAAVASPSPRGPIYRDPVASSLALAQYTCPGDRLSDPASLRHSRVFSDVAARFTELGAYITRFAIATETDCRNDERRVAEARRDAKALEGKLEAVEEKAAAERKRADEQIKRLASELSLMKKKRDEDEAKIELQKVMVAKRDAHIAAQQKQLDAEQERFDSERGARQELKKKMLRAAEMAADLAGPIQVNLSLLTQADANLELLGELKGGKVASIEDEIAKIEAEKVGLADAEKAYDEVLADLRGMLRVSPISDGVSAGLTAAEPLEVEAARVGVEDLSGTNQGFPGLAELAATGHEEILVADLEESVAEQPKHVPEAARAASASAD